MQIENIFYLKVFVYLICLLSYSIYCDGAIELKKKADKMYKKILKMRSLPFEDCGSSFDIVYLNVSSCNRIPCEMQRGSKALVNVIFDDNGYNTSYLKHHVSWIFNAIRRMAHITPDPCEGDHACLLSSNDGKSYFATVLVDDFLPTIRGTMLWEAVDAKGENVMCFRIPIVIVE